MRKSEGNICRKFAQCSHMFDLFVNFFFWSFSCAWISSQFHFSSLSFFVFSYDNNIVCKFDEGEGRRGRAMEKGHRMSDMKIENEREAVGPQSDDEFSMRARRGDEHTQCKEGNFIDFHFHFNSMMEHFDPLVAISRSNKIRNANRVHRILQCFSWLR